jgi:hypothetical protein
LEGLGADANTSFNGLWQASGCGHMGAYVHRNRLSFFNVSQERRIIRREQ